MCIKAIKRPEKFKKRANPRKVNCLFILKTNDWIETSIDTAGDSPKNCSNFKRII